LGVAHAFEQRARAAEEHAAAVKEVLLSRAGHVVPDHTAEDEEEPVDSSATLKTGGLS
jgi:hypothetical protein